jgi:DNA-binding winged helix-turn-helix (wHTH) protein
MAMPMIEAFAFGPFRLLVEQRKLLAHGVPVAIGLRAFEILLLLVRRHGHLVPKDEVMAEVRPGSWWKKPRDGAIASWHP